MAECQDYYELAIGEDPNNALLFDRYAFFLLRQQKIVDALGKADRATGMARRAIPKCGSQRGLSSAISANQKKL